MPIKLLNKYNMVCAVNGLVITTYIAFINYRNVLSSKTWDESFSSVVTKYAKDAHEQPHGKLIAMLVKRILMPNNIVSLKTTFLLFKGDINFKVALSIPYRF